MTLVERYVRAVRDFLPRAQKDDISNELSDSIQSRFEDEAASRGRPLTEDEQVAILRSLGHPMAVAARFRGDDRSVRFGGQLIGPELFPTYLTVLRINLAITLIIGAVSLISTTTRVGRKPATRAGPYASQLRISGCRRNSSKPTNRANTANGRL